MVNYKNKIHKLLKNNLVLLEPVNENNIELLIKWTKDPIAQGEYKKVLNLKYLELYNLFLNSNDRFYYLIKILENGKSIGRFYFREWKFQRTKIDWEINIIIALPEERKKGFGKSIQKLVANYLIDLEETNSVFAYTDIRNIAEQRSLEKCSFNKIGLLPNEYSRVQAISAYFNRSNGVS